MEKDQLTIFRQTIEDLKRAAREDCQRRIEKLDAALAVAEEMGFSTETTEADLSESAAVQGLIWQESLESNGSKPFVLKEEVRSAIRSWRGHAFRQRDITHIIRAKHPGVRVHAGSVSATLKKLAERGDLEVVSESRGGSEPTVYREVALSP